MVRQGKAQRRKNWYKASLPFRTEYVQGGGGGTSFPTAQPHEQKESCATIQEYLNWTVSDQEFACIRHVLLSLSKPLNY